MIGKSWRGAFSVQLISGVLELTRGSHIQKVYCTPAERLRERILVSKLVGRDMIEHTNEVMRC